MGVKQLAQRLGIDPAAVVRLEKREAAGKVTLESLHRAAEALDSKLVYALVPNEDLQSMLLTQARRVAQARLRRVGHTMGLEAQGVDSEETARLATDLAMQLLREWPRSLWDNPDTEGQANAR
jgi:predicted DNA-binding mobile mystery protein A